MERRGEPGPCRRPVCSIYLALLKDKQIINKLSHRPFELNLEENIHQDSVMIFIKGWGGVALVHGIVH